MATARSSTGDWAVSIGDGGDARLAGPFDGKTPAETFARMMRRHGYQANAVRIWSPGQVTLAMRLDRVAP